MNIYSAMLSTLRSAFVVMWAHLNVKATGQPVVWFHKGYIMLEIFYYAKLKIKPSIGKNSFIETTLKN
jgi:hypothetical protein